METVMPRAPEQQIRESITLISSELCDKNLVIVTKRFVRPELGLTRSILDHYFRTHPDFVEAIGCKRQRVLPLELFKEKIRRYATMIRQRGETVTMPMLVIESENEEGMEEKMPYWVIQKHFDRYPDFRAEIGVVPAPKGRCRSAKRRQN